MWMRMNIDETADAVARWRSHRGERMETGSDGFLCPSLGGSWATNVAPLQAKRKELRMSESRRRPRPSLHEEIAEIIRDRIAEGGLPAGSFIDEPALAL